MKKKKKNFSGKKGRLGETISFFFSVRLKLKTTSGYKLIVYLYIYTH